MEWTSSEAICDGMHSYLWFLFLAQTLIVSSISLSDNKIVHNAHSEKKELGKNFSHRHRYHRSFSFILNTRSHKKQLVFTLYLTRFVVMTPTESVCHGCTTMSCKSCAEQMCMLCNNGWMNKNNTLTHTYSNFRYMTTRQFTKLRWFVEIWNSIPSKLCKLFYEMVLGQWWTFWHISVIHLVISLRCRRREKEQTNNRNCMCRCVFSQKHESMWKKQQHSQSLDAICDFYCSLTSWAHPNGVLIEFSKGFCEKFGKLSDQV